MASSEDENSSQYQVEEDNVSCLASDSEYEANEWFIRKQHDRSSDVSNSSDNEHCNNDEDDDCDDKDEYEDDNDNDNDNDSDDDSSDYAQSVYEINSNNDEEPIEILEENNNDPNNNMDDENNESHVTVINEQRIPSPQPGCSKAFDDIEKGVNNTDINKIAKRILQQISTITHESIVVALKKAQTGNNRKEISLSELLPVAQVGLKRPHTNNTCSVIMKKITREKSPPTESSPIKAGSFLTRIVVDLTENNVSCHLDNQPENILNHCHRALNYRHKLSPTLRNSVIDVESNTPLSIPSTSNQKNGLLPIISDPHYAKPIINLPDPESNLRKVHVSEYRGSVSGKHNEAFMLQPSESTAEHDSQVNRQSSQPHATIVVDEYIEIPKGHTDNELSTRATCKLHLDSPPILEPHTHNSKTSTSKINSEYSNAPATITRNAEAEKLQRLSARKACPFSTETLDRQYAHIKQIKVNKTLNTPATITTAHQNHPHNYHFESHKQRTHSELDMRAARKCFAFSANTIVDQTAHINKVRAINDNQKHKSLPRENLDANFQIREFEEELRACHAAHSRRQKGELEGMIPEPILKPTASQQLAAVRLLQNIPHHRHAEALNGYQYNPQPAFMNYRDPAQPGPSRREPDNNQSVCGEIYQKLRAMFPILKREYIKKFCPSNWTIGLEHDVQLSNIVDRILTEELLWEYDDEMDQMLNLDGAIHTGVKNEVPNVEETCEYLAGVFPDADPHYLRDAAITFKDENAVKEFVDQQLKKRNYPTREQYLAKLKITQEQERYTTNFVVADFVKIFPDPFRYFEDPKRICQFAIVCLEFLKAIHNRIRVHTISTTYTECNYNMSLATKRLKSCNEEMKTRRASRETPTSDIPILQEMAFIRHQDAIKKYIDQIQSNERQEFDRLKTQGQLLVCQCCYDDECMPSKCSKCENGHIFCNSCITTGTDSKLGDGEAHVSCFLACGSEFSLSTLQNILSPTKFSILLKKRQAAEVMAAGLEGLVSCPFCHFASIPAEGDKVFKCLNPECMKESCIKCKEPNHVPLRCHEVDKTDKARKYIEEKMTQALARSCYKCKRSFFKEEGCNKITCPCGAIMCYLCDKPIKDYSHFAGQGSDDKTKCPLWTDNQRLNAETVRKVAEVARSELLRQDPTLVLNTDGLAPELPPPTNGPHNHIVGAQNIAVQLAARVMKENRK